jgi:hypothetical protein
MDEEKRSDYQNESITSLKKAAELDSRSWQTYYELGLQQALLKDMVSASSSIRRSIKLNGNFLPSWHLLSLVQSSRQFNALPRALQVMDAGLKESDLWDLKTSKRMEQDDELEMYDEAEHYMRLRMSQTYLLELLEGPHAVLDVYSDLYQTYASIDKKFFNNNKSGNSITGSSSTLIERPSSPVGFKSRRVSSLHAISESGSTSRPRSYSNRTNRSDSIKSNSESTPSLPLEDDEEQKKSEPSEVSLEEEKEAKRHRRSLTLTRTLMNDPLISLPSSKKKDKEQREKERQEKKEQKEREKEQKEREKQEKKERKELEKSEKKNRKSSFLTIKPSFKSSDVDSSSSKKGKNGHDSTINNGY